MKRMSPSDSEHRLGGRREPTDAQKTARIAIIRNRQAQERLGMFNIPKAIDNSYRRITTEMNSIRNKMALSKKDSLSSKSFGSIWALEPSIAVDDTPADNLMYREDGTETWLRPEPYADYQANYNATMREIEMLVKQEEDLENRLQQLQQNIDAEEAGGTLFPDSPNVKDSISVYRKLSDVRNRLNTLAVGIDEGVVQRDTGTMGKFAVGGIGGAGLVLGAFVAWRLYRRMRPRRAGPRYTGNTDRLAIFGNIA